MWVILYEYICRFKFFALLIYDELLKMLYREKTTNVEVNNKYSVKRCRISKDVRQGCPLSPRLFQYMYIDEIMMNANINYIGFKINGKIISCANGQS